MLECRRNNLVILHPHSVWLHASQREAKDDAALKGRRNDSPGCEPSDCRC